VLQINTNSSESPTGIYSYSINGYDTNGNLLSYTDSVTGTWNSIGYDGLNRLTAASATAGYFAGLQTGWSYDSFGNPVLPRAAQSMRNFKSRFCREIVPAKRTLFSLPVRPALKCSTRSCKFRTKTRQIT
jgi:hypothetical protein